MEPPPEQQQQPERPPEKEAPRPYAMEAAGPAITLETSEALFSLATALNTCGYDAGLAESDPVRQQVRDDMTAALNASVEAQASRNELCGFIGRHRLSDAGHELAQYVSLAVYMTPQLELGVDEQEMPPDANAVANILPILHEFAEQTQLHLIWVKHRPQYEEIVARLHDPLTRMILETNIYLKQPISAYSDRRFLVLVEPMLSPAQTNARIYGTDYLLVTSPAKLQPDAPAQASVRMNEIRHIYLHYEIEPLVYARSSSIARLTPLLGAVQSAPLDYTEKNDVIALVTECLIKAIEARTLEIADKKPKPPETKEREPLVAYAQALAVYEKHAEQMRRELVDKDVHQGYVLTQYFYEQLQEFERGPSGLNENIGQMVYGMDVAREKQRAKQIVFNSEGSTELLGRAPQPMSELDLAELKLQQGDTDAAATLAQKVLDSKTGDLGEAHFLMARIESREGLMDDATASFEQTLTLSTDAHTSAWAHIYLGRIYDIQQKRDQALAEYHAALALDDSAAQKAAQAGIDHAFTVPKREQDDNDVPLDPTGKAQKDAYRPEPSQSPVPQQ